MKRIAAALLVAVATASIVKAAAGLLCVAISPELIGHVNDAGVPLALQAVAAAACLAAAVRTFGTGPVRLIYATMWSVAAGEFASPPLELIGVALPRMQTVLAAIVVVALAEPCVLARVPASSDKKKARRALALAACAVAAAAAMVALHFRGEVSRYETALFFMLVLLGITFTTVALKRRAT